MRREPEIRMNGDALDEVVADNCQFHLEQMDTGHWWMSVTSGGKRVHINLYSKRKIKASVEVEAE